MFRKNNKPIELQSSQSDVSSDNERESPQARHRSPNQQHSDNERDSLSESQDNEQEDSLQNTSYQKREIKQGDQSEQHSDEQQQSSDQGGEAYFRNINSRNGIHTIRQDPGQGLQQQDSIDHIQQRIKKLEKDLQTRLNKHKDKPQNNKKQQGKIISKASPHPPIPQKKSNHSQDSQNKMGNMNRISQKLQEPKQKNNQKIQHMKKSNQSFQAQANQTMKPKRIISKQTKQPNPEIKMENRQQVKPTPEISKRPIKAKKEPIQRQQQKANVLFNDKVATSESRSKVNELEKLVKELRLENQILKQKLDSQKSRKDKPKNKAVQQLQKLKQASSIGDKLEKQIQLLQVIEKLQVKLKKSISRKLAKQGNAASSLLHKGLPTSIQSHY